MPFQVGAANPRWNGGRWLSSAGYVWVYVGVDHPCNRSGVKGYAPKHLLVFWQHTGRFPEPGHHIHHRNGIKSDNRWRNLVEKENDEHGRLHLPKGSDRAKELGSKGGKATARMRRRLKKRGGRPGSRGRSRKRPLVLC